MPSYKIDPQHTAAHFKVRHMMISYVRGDFSGISGSVTFDAAHPEASRVEAQIDAASVNTREASRDQHLRSSEFLDVRQYPVMTFQSSTMVPLGGDRYDLPGLLTIHGVTREAVLHVRSLTPEIKDPDGLYRRGAVAAARVQRRDFGLTWNAVLESGGFLVGDDVEITIDVELLRTAE